MATRRFASALENIARLSKKWRYRERERERGESEELARQVACGSSAMGGATLDHASRFPSMDGMVGRPLSRLAGNRFVRSYQH